MGASRQLIDAVTGVADERLRGLGFTRRRYGYIIEVTPEVLGWVGLNRDVRRGDNKLLINPVLGIRHQAVEREVARRRGEKFHPHFPPTISAPLSQLARGPFSEFTKRGTHYLFEEVREKKLERQVKKMVDTIATYAFRFFKAHSSLQALAAALRLGDYGFPHQLVYRVPVALTLLGQDSDALDAVRASVAELGDREDLAAQKFRAFADTFISHSSTVGKTAELIELS